MTTTASEMPDDGTLTVFLGGPLQFLKTSSNSASVVTRHRAMHEALVGGGFSVVSAHEVEEYGDLSDGMSPDVVTTRDFEWARCCDAYVAVLPVDAGGVPYRTDGTHIELGWATAMGKSVVVVIDDRPSQPYSHLVRGLIQTGQVTAVLLSRWESELVAALRAAHAVRLRDRSQMPSVAVGGRTG